MNNKIDIKKYKNKAGQKAFLAVHGPAQPLPEYVNSHFFLGPVPHRLTEKLQIVSGSNKKVQVLAFDPHPEMTRITGYLLAYKDEGDWLRDFANEVEKGKYSMRALVANNKHVRLYYSDRWIKGYILGVDYTEDPDSDPLVIFTMEWLVLEVHRGEWGGDDSDERYIDSPIPGIPVDESFA